MTNCLLAELQSGSTLKCCSVNKTFVDDLKHETSVVALQLTSVSTAATTPQPIGSQTPPVSHSVRNNTTHEHDYAQTSVVEVIFVSDV